MHQFAEVISIFKDLVLAGSAFTGAYVAFKGLETWKEQLTWTNKSELKRNILIELYALQESIKLIRTPLKGDISTISTSYKERYLNRWRTMTTHKNKLRAYIPEVLATWKHSNLSDIIEKFEPHLRTLSYAVYCQILMADPNTDRQTRQELHAERRKNGNIIFSPKDNDTFGQSIDQIVKEFEEYLEARLK